MHIPLGKIPNEKELVDLAFRRATETASRERGMAKQRQRTRLQKSQQLERVKISTVQQTLERQLGIIVQRFPRFDQLDPFYQDLMVCTLDVDHYRKSLGALQWASKRIKQLCANAKKDIARTKLLPQVNAARTACYGRVASVLKQVKHELTYLEQCRKTIRAFPSVRTGMPTIVIAGFPNVGKTTVLKALTGAEPEIAAYPFTTKNLRLGYYDNVQVIDTPGLLDRPLRRRNPIERQAILALEHLAKVILFVLDPSEACGYALQEQRNLLAEVRKAFARIPFVVTINKADLLEPEQAQAFAKEFNALLLAAQDDKGIPALRAILDKHVGKA